MKSEIVKITERLENGNIRLSEAQNELLQFFNKNIADLNHTIINSAMNISALSNNDPIIQEECSKIINEIRKFSKQF